MIRKISNPPNPFRSSSLHYLDLEEDDLRLGAPEIFEERAKSIVSENKSPDLGFRFSVNPYRGCFHACAYCYARPTHQYLDFGAGTDFERKLVAKINAPELLELHLRKSSWNGDTIVFSGVTDCYQPIEANYELTKRCLEVCRKYENPVGIITKAALIQRDIDLLSDLHRKAGVHVHVSLAFYDLETARKFEPSTPSPAARLRTMKRLSEAGIPVGVSVSPVIPGISDTEVPKILEAAAANGATSAFMTLLRLPAEVEEVFFERVRESYPEREQKIISGLLEMKEGKMNRSQFGDRMRGTGARWEAVEWLFRTSCEKFGIQYSLERDYRVMKSTTSSKSETRLGEQLSLFRK